VTTQRPPDGESGAPRVVSLLSDSGSSADAFAVPGLKNSDYTDGRSPGAWESKYPEAARRCMRQEACILVLFLFVTLLFSAVSLGLSSQALQVPIPWLTQQEGTVTDATTLVLKIDFRLLTIFFVGSLGGTTFSIKWLVHSAAKCKWHLDRRYWRFFVPLIGGVYACVVLTLADGGVIAAQTAGQPRSVGMTAALAFLVGYFSDGVSGLLSNIANAVFGTLEKK
jgi:hypothetical protein